MSKKQPTFEDAIADLNNITAFNATQHFPLIIAGLNEAASRIRALEAKVAKLETPNASPAK
jgi:hypothetical protein